MNDALDDPFIQELIDKFGHCGYVAWFGLFEIIAKENGNELTCKLSIDPSYLKRKMHISTKKLEEIFDFCSRKLEENSEKTQRKPKLFFDKTLEKWKFYVPKMLDLKDNYTKDLQAASNKHSNQAEAEAEADKEKNYSEDSIEYKLSMYLVNHIRKNLPEFKKPNLQSWSKTFGVIIRNDSKDIETLKTLIRYVQTEPFYIPNVLSPTKFHKRFNEIKLRYHQSTKPKQNNQNNQKNQIDETNSKLAAMRKKTMEEQ